MTHRSAKAFFLQLGVRFVEQSSCKANASMIDRYDSRVPSSWIYDPLRGRSGPRPGGHRLLSCLFALFTCPQAALQARVSELRHQLPVHWVAAHARFGHQSAGHEQTMISRINALYEKAPSSHWEPSANRVLPLSQRLAPWDRLLALELPRLCHAVCASREGHERLLPNPFLCCGTRDFEQFGAAIEQAAQGALRTRAYITTDLAAFQHFVRPTRCMFGFVCVHALACQR